MYDPGTEMLLCTDFLFVKEVQLLIKKEIESE